jgi:hypothetical protein
MVASLLSVQVCSSSLCLSLSQALSFSSSLSLSWPLSLSQALSLSLSLVASVVPLCVCVNWRHLSLELELVSSYQTVTIFSR